MSLWKRYVKMRESRHYQEGSLDGDDPASAFKFNTDDDAPHDYEKLQNELFRVVLGKYPGEVMEFFNNIAQRGDEEISSLLKKMGVNGGSMVGKKPQHPRDFDNEVVPSKADTGYSDGSDSFDN